tara:strand:+ start:533 stop:1315 length:783 start_codon:yes stop_codon:yes gene_type:complete
MSWTSLAWASKQKAGSGNNKLVLLMLANFANDKHECFPSFKTLCKMTELSKGTIIRCISSLEKLGLINVKRRFMESQNNRQTSNLYILNVVYQNETPQCQSDTPLYQSETPSSIRQTPHITSNIINLKKNKSKSYSDEFEKFWKEYPDRPNDNKHGAYLKFQQSLKEIKYDDLLEKTKQFAKSQIGADKKFIPQAKTWLNQKRYNDEIAVEKNESDSSDDWVIKYWNSIDTEKERERFSNGVYSSHVKRLMIEGKIHNAS